MCQTRHKRIRIHQCVSWSKIKSFSKLSKKSFLIFMFCSYALRIHVCLEIRTIFYAAKSPINIKGWHLADFYSVWKFYIFWFILETGMFVCLYMMSATDLHHNLIPSFK